MIYQTFIRTIPGRKLFAILIDPEGLSPGELRKIIQVADAQEVDWILIGGSLISEPLDGPIELIKSLTGIPVVLFPGSLWQLSTKADAILLLSLISGRNPEHLIGNHVLAAPILKKSTLEIISTSYILTGQADQTAVGYMSHSRPIPDHKTDLVVATAQAGELLGHKLTYLEAGSGAQQAISAATISAVRKSISIPLIVGGGIKSESDADAVYAAGADMIVIGNAIEKKTGLIRKIAGLRSKYT